MVPPSGGVAVAANLVNVWSGGKCKAWYLEGEVDASRLPRSESLGDEQEESISLLVPVVVCCGVIVFCGAGARGGGRALGWWLTCAGGLDVTVLTVQVSEMFSFDQ
jgi:hypothetical protein